MKISDKLCEVRNEILQNQVYYSIWTTPSEQIHRGWKHCRPLHKLAQKVLEMKERRQQYRITVTHSILLHLYGMFTQLFKYFLWSHKGYFHPCLYKPTTSLKVFSLIKYTVNKLQRCKYFGWQINGLQAAACTNHITCI